MAVLDSRGSAVQTRLRFGNVLCPPMPTRDMPKNCWLLSTLCLLLCCLSSGLAADSITNAHFSVRIWDSDEDLPQNSVVTMTQTRDGYLWLGTLAGLVRFDGVQF